MNEREISWCANQLMFERELEAFLSHCPNMTEEDDLRDLCNGKCPAHHWCISIEPAEVPPPLPGNPTPPCPKCGSMDIRIVYKDDDATEVDFYDCLMCRTVWTPTKQITQNPDEPKMNINMMRCPDCGAWYHMSFGHICKAHEVDYGE